MPQVHTLPYCKMALHAVKFPHCSVHGLLVGRQTKKSSDDNVDAVEKIEVVDAFPIFHNIVVASPLEIALIHVSEFCRDRGLKIVGSYFANERKDDDSMDILWAKPLREKLMVAETPTPITIRIDNNKLSLNSTESCLITYVYDAGKWKQLNTELVRYEETLSSYSAALQSKLHRELNDFETHLDDPTTSDFYNQKLSDKLLSLSA